jgi:hypothetical protein
MPLLPSVSFSWIVCTDCIEARSALVPLVVGK